MPAYNEEACLAKTLGDITSFLLTQSYTWELIIVDDGSSDQTSALAGDVVDRFRGRATLLRNEINRGKGFSVKRGVMTASGRNVFFTDADLSTPIEELTKGLPLLDDADVVVGSRALIDSNIIVHQPAHRERLGRIFNAVVRATLVKGIKDTQCGFKGFKSEAARAAFSRQRLAGFGFDVEVLYIANKLGFKIIEAPVAWRHSAATHVSPIQDGLGMIGDLARVRINDIKGLYD